MKKLLLILIAISPILVNAQNKITLKTGESFIAKVEGFYGTNLVFINLVPQLGSDRVNIAEVTAIEGTMPNSRMKAILRKNPDVKFLTTQITEQQISEMEKKQSGNVQMNAKSPGDLIKLSAQLRLSGLTLSTLTATVIAAGAFKDNTDAIKAVAIGSGVLSLGLYIAGESVQIKAGKLMNEQITIVPASTGIGLAINF